MRVHHQCPARHIVLGNGLAWIQTSGDGVGHLAHLALSYSARIGRDSGGSNAMELTGLPRTVAVRRLR